MKWNVLDTGVKSAQKNMAIDAELLEKMDPKDAPLLHFYEWESPSVTYGYFLRPDAFFDLPKAKTVGLSLARRPTGGGVTFHLTDFAFSVLIPAGFPHYFTCSLDNYHFINSLVKRAVKGVLKKTGLSLLTQTVSSTQNTCADFCMAKPTQYDVMLGPWKIAGAAQRRKKQGYLHQGSISITLPDQALLQAALLNGKDVYHAMSLHTCSLLGQEGTPADLKEMQRLLKRQLEEECAQ